MLSRAIFGIHYYSRLCCSIVTQVHCWIQELNIGGTYFFFIFLPPLFFFFHYFNYTYKMLEAWGLGTEGEEGLLDA